ncbi:MAG: tetratricopeptide repeat protein [Candidatus Margulisiibacteriota bacterium]|mgnify:FL=1
MAIRRNFCPYCGRKLHWYGLPEVNLSKPILQAILKRKNFLVKQRLQHIETFYFQENATEIPLLELQDALTINPNNAKAHFQLALFYLEKKRPDKAKESLMQVLRIEPMNSHAFFQLATIAIEEEQFEQALLYFDKVLEHEPDNLSARYNKAVAYYYRGDWERSLAEFRQIQVKEPENADVLDAIKEIVAKWN